MYERHSQPLASIGVFILRLMRSILFAIFIILIALGIGMLGYHNLEHMSWVDAYINAAMILSGMGPVTPLASNSAKIFAGTYALFSGLVFIAVMGVIFTPILHRLFHKFHLDTDVASKRKKESSTNKK